MRVYLDNCCFNRPFDDQTQTRIRLEAEAKLDIQQRVTEKQIELTWSFDAVHCGGRMMVTDTEIKTAGLRALVAALGDVRAERFIALIQREPFDYTKWQRTLWPEKEDLDELSQAAMRHRQTRGK